MIYTGDMKLCHNAVPTASDSQYNERRLMEMLTNVKIEETWHWKEGSCLVLVQSLFRLPSTGLGNPLMDALFPPASSLTSKLWSTETQLM